MDSAAARTRAPKLSSVVSALVPIVVIAVLIALFLALDPIGTFREVPPAEALAVEKTVLDKDQVRLSIRNDGPDPVTIAQVLVNDAYWNFTIFDRTLGRLEATDLEIPYPWEEGLPLHIAIVTSTGLTIEHEIEAAALTPDFDAGTLGVYALLGLYIGVIPVTVGLLWFSALRRASRRWVGFFLAFTAGLLAFLLVDTVAEGLDLSAAAPEALDGIGLFAIGALGAVVGLVSLQSRLENREQAAHRAGLILAYLIAAGIGLHNLGEGLAVGAALAVGEIALGTFLVVGFAIHNTTEGLAIVAPLGSERDRPSLWHFVALGALAGVPTIGGAWLGGFAYTAAWSALAFGVAAGAISQVIWQIGKGMAKSGAVLADLNGLGFVSGLIFMYATGLLTA
ncbi:MAG: metal transporter [Actinomycetota bacterium]|nr:metal transporter [Actinomycetota bacterium]